MPTRPRYPWLQWSQPTARQKVTAPDPCSPSSASSAGRFASEGYSAASATSPLESAKINRRDTTETDVQIEILFCGVCHSDLHTVRNEWAEAMPTVYPVVPGHEIVGVIAALGTGITDLAIGDRVGIPWLGHTCGTCRFCRSEHENLCDEARFTGYQIDGGFATHCIADANYCFPLPAAYDDIHAAPLLCAGLIGYRSLKAAGDAPELMVVGGAALYAEMLPLADRLYLTRVHASFEADTFFPEIDFSQWKALSSEQVPAGDKNEYAHSYTEYVRKGSSLL